MVHGGTGDKAALFGGVGGGADQPAGFGVLDQEVAVEAGGFAHDRPGVVAQKVEVAGIEVALPEVEAEPAAASDPDAMVGVVDGGGTAPEIEVVV